MNNGLLFSLNILCMLYKSKNVIQPQTGSNQRKLNKYKKDILKATRNADTWHLRPQAKRTAKFTLDS